MFKRVGLVSLLVTALMLTGILVAGCGQSTPEVRTEVASPQNLVCKGIVYGNFWYDGGSWDYSHVIGPVAGAIVNLVGSYETKSTVTNADGEYVFENVKYGSYRVEASKEGYQKGEVYFETEFGVFVDGLNASSAKASAVPEGAIFTEDINLWINPVMSSVTPIPSSTIETDAVFIVTFNKPMDTTTVRPSFVSDGLRFFATGDTVSVTTAWSGNDTVLTITPNSPLQPNQVYHLYLGPTEFAEVRDKDGYRLATATYYYDGIPVEENGNVVVNEDFFTYYTSTGGAPGAPANLTVTVSGMPFSSEAGVGADYVDIYSSGVIPVGLNWTAGSGTITGYKVYVSDSASNNYRLLSSPYSPYGYTQDIHFDTTVEKILQALYGSIYVDPLGSGNYPMINQPTYFKVVAFNGEYESSAAAASAIDLVGPRLNTIAYSGRTAGLGKTAEMLNNNYYLPALVAGTDTTIAYIAFVEPVDASTIAAAYFQHTDNVDTPKGTVTDATLLTSSSGNLSGTWAGGVFSIVKITTDTDFAVTDKIKVGTEVKDLAGNPVVSGTIDTVSIP